MWINFEQSPNEDETISNTFSARGLYRISSDKDVNAYPKVFASVQNQRMVLAIDETLLILEDELVDKCNVLSFDANIDCVIISTSGNLIICCLTNGVVHGVAIRGQLLFSHCIQRDDININGERTFAHIQFVKDRYCSVCTNGSVYSVSYIDETYLETKLLEIAEESETEPGTLTILNDVSLQKLYSIRFMIGITAALLISSEESPEEPILIAGSNNLLLQRTSSGKDIVRLKLLDDYKGVKHIYNLENAIIILTNSGHLLSYCLFTNILKLSNITREQLLFDELIVMDLTEEHREFLMLTKSILTEDNNDRALQMVEYPSLKCVNELSVGAHAWLVQQPKSSVNLYYISGEECNANNFPTILELMLISETDPSDRFKKLVAKGHLEDAEEFGKQYNLSLQPIYEARAKRLIMNMDMCDTNNPEELNKRFNNLLELLDKIDNKDFFRANRMLRISSRTVLKEYLLKILNHFDELEDQKDIIEIREQLNRLKTLSIIDPYEIKDNWLNFVYHNNLLKYLISLLQNDIPTTCLIWKRHSTSIIPQLDESDLRKLLALIPNDTKPFNLLQWLKQFIPVVSNTHPNLMPFVTEWSIQKIRLLQYTDHWPEIGLELANKIVEIYDELEYIHINVRRQHDLNLAKLRELDNALQELFVLKKSYNLIFSLDNYQQESVDETAKCILFRVHLDHLKSLVNDFLYPIYQEKGKSPVHAIKRYITLLVASRSTFSTWLERSVACIELLHHEDDRLEMGLLVLQNSPVPWPDTVKPLLKLRNSTHPLALKINTEYDIQVIKIMKAKYDWPTDSAADIDLHLFMLRIVKMDLKDMLDDIRTLTKAAPEIATAASFNCCYQLVRRGKIQTAHDYFQSLELMKSSNKTNTNEIVELFAEYLENTNLIDAETDVDLLNEERELISFFKLILPKSSNTMQKRYNLIKNRFTLRYKYKIISIQYVTDLVSYKNCLSYLDEGINYIISNMSKSEDICKYILSELGELCKALYISRIFGVTKLCQRLDCLILSCALTYNLLDILDYNVKMKNDCINLALELISQQIKVFLDKSIASTALSDQDPLAFPLAYKLLSNASLYEYNQLPELSEFLNYIFVAKNCYYADAIENFYDGRNDKINELICSTLVQLDIKNSKDSTIVSVDNSFEVKVTSKSKQRYSISIFDDVGVTQNLNKYKIYENDHIYVVKFIVHTLLLLINETQNLSGYLSLLKDHLISGEKVSIDIENLRVEFFESLGLLIKSKKHQEWYTIVQYLMHYQKNNNCRLINCDLVSLQMIRMLRNEMSNKNVDFIDLFVVLISDPHAPSLLEKLAAEMRTDQQKLNYLTLAEMYNLRYEVIDELEIIRNRRVKHYYYMEFCKQDHTLKGKFNAEIDPIELLIREFHNKQLDVHLLKRMSRDFNLDHQKLLVTQVISILQCQKMQYECKPDAFGGEELIMITTVEQMRQLCEPYINEIKNTELLVSKLLSFINEIHLYFYELYLCVIELLSYINAVPPEMQLWSSILHFLKHKMSKRRCNRPGQLETDMWFESQKDIGVLPKIARFRLPFKPIVEQPLKDILDTELTVDNCESWFPLIQMHTTLKGSKDIAHHCDYFCMSAVKNSVVNYKSKDNTSDTWRLQPTNNAFLKSILRLIQYVHNPSKAFMILYFVASYAAEGADQVEASYECYKFAIEKESMFIDNKCQEQLKKIKRKYPILKTQHILHMYGLYDEKLMPLLENPTELICHLYHLDMILTGIKVDINAVVKEIAELYELDLGPIHFQLLQKWLAINVSKPNENGTLNDTLLEEQQTTETPHEKEEIYVTTENVIRATYVIKSWPTDIAEQFFVAHIFSSNGKSDIFQQLQMYECCLKLYNGSNMFGNLLDQRKYITIKCVHELKKLGYNLSLEKFNESNKIDVLKTVWQKNSNNAQSLQVLADICLGFDIYMSKIWNGILKRMVMFNMKRELNALVEVLSSKPPLAHIDGLVMAWEWVLLEPFIAAEQMQAVDQDALLHKALFRIQSCSVIHSLQLKRFVDHCLRLEKPHMAAIFLIFCTNNEMRNELRMLIQKSSKSTLRQDILDLEDAGILSVILSFALKELNL